MQVYADNAATAKMRPAAIQTYISTAKEYYGNPSSLHEAGQAAKELLEESRAHIANMIGAEAREIIFTSGGSEADNQAIFSAAMFGAKKGKKKIVSTAIEHHAVLHALDRLKSEGFEIVLAPVGPNGIVNTAALEQAIDENTCLVSVMLANNEIGTIQPVREIGAICKAKGVLFHTDAVQAVGHIPVDVTALNADYLALSAHKFGGPRGVGALYVKKGALVPPCGRRRTGARQTGGNRKFTRCRRNGNRPQRITSLSRSSDRKSDCSARETDRRSFENPSFRAERRPYKTACGQCKFLLRGNRRRGLIAVFKRHGRIRFLRIGVHVGIIGSFARPACDRTRSRRRARFASFDAQRRKHRRRDRLSVKSRSRSSGKNSQFFPRVARFTKWKTQLYFIKRPNFQEKKYGTLQ